MINDIIKKALNDEDLTREKIASLYRVQLFLPDSAKILEGPSRFYRS